MRLYDEEAHLTGSMPKTGDTSHDWQHRAIDRLINVTTSIRWKWRWFLGAIRWRR